jgi:putative component of toxin-antitoxin plasmid stabilization module
VESNHKNVILLVPETWTYMSFETDSGRDVAVEWDTHQSFAANEAFRALIKNSKKIRNHLEWPAWRHAMDEKAGEAGVVELGFKADKPYRVLCMFNGRKCIVVLCVAYHKQNAWTPREAVNIATQRAKLVAAGKAKLNVIQSEDDL